MATAFCRYGVADLVVCGGDQQFSSPKEKGKGQAAPCGKRDQDLGVCGRTCGSRRAGAPWIEARCCPATRQSQGLRGSTGRRNARRGNRHLLPGQNAFLLQPEDPKVTRRPAQSVPARKRCLSSAVSDRGARDRASARTSSRLPQTSHSEHTHHLALSEGRDLPVTAQRDVVDAHASDCSTASAAPPVRESHSRTVPSLAGAKHFAVVGSNDDRRDFVRHGRATPADASSPGGQIADRAVRPGGHQPAIRDCRRARSRAPLMPLEHAFRARGTVDAPDQHVAALADRRDLFAVRAELWRHRSASRAPRRLTSLDGGQVINDHPALCIPVDDAITDLIEARRVDASALRRLHDERRPTSTRSAKCVRCELRSWG